MLQVLQSVQIAAGVSQVYQFKEETTHFFGFLGNLLLHCGSVRGGKGGSASNKRGIGMKVHNVS